MVSFVGSEKMITFASNLFRSLNRKVGRVIDRAGLEIRYTLLGIGGLNPSPSAEIGEELLNRLFFFCSYPVVVFRKSITFALV